MVGSAIGIVIVFPDSVIVSVSVSDMVIVIVSVRDSVIVGAPLLF